MAGCTAPGLLCQCHMQNSTATATGVTNLAPCCGCGAELGVAYTADRTMKQRGNSAFAFGNQEYATHGWPGIGVDCQRCISCIVMHYRSCATGAEGKPSPHRPASGWIGQRGNIGACMNNTKAHKCGSVLQPSPSPCLQWAASPCTCTGCHPVLTAAQRPWVLAGSPAACCSVARHSDCCNMHAQCCWAQVHHGRHQPMLLPLLLPPLLQVVALLLHEHCLWSLQLLLLCCRDLLRVFVVLLP